MWVPFAVTGVVISKEALVAAYPHVARWKKGWNWTRAEEEEAIQPKRLCRVVIPLKVCPQGHSVEDRDWASLAVWTREVHTNRPFPSSLSPGSSKNRKDPKILGTSKVSSVCSYWAFAVTRISGFLDYSNGCHRSTSLLPSNRTQVSVDDLIKTTLPLVIVILKCMASVDHIFLIVCSLHYIYSMH